MWFSILLALLLMSAFVFAAWPWPEDSAEEGERSTSPAGMVRPESLEGVLVAQVVAGEITRRQYSREMERLAARDEKRHPLSVPPPKADA